MAAGGNAGSYRCNRSAKRPDGGKGCGKVNRKFEALEEHVVAKWADHMREVTGSRNYLSPALLATARGEDSEAERLTSERDEINRRIQRTRHGYAMGQS